MAIRFTVPNRDAMVHNGEPFAEALIAPLIFGTIIGTNPLGFAPPGDQVIKELCSPPAVKSGDWNGFYPFGEGIYSYQQILVSVGVQGEGSS